MVCRPSNFTSNFFLNNVRPEMMLRRFVFCIYGQCNQTRFNVVLKIFSKRLSASVSLLTTQLPAWDVWTKLAPNALVCHVTWQAWNWRHDEVSTMTSRQWQSRRRSDCRLVLCLVFDHRNPRNNARPLHTQPTRAGDARKVCNKLNGRMHAADATATKSPAVAKIADRTSSRSQPAGTSLRFKNIGLWSLHTYTTPTTRQSCWVASAS